jgi:prepilin-type N-terminal cleavage/methylation domain-containing protein
MKRVKTRASSGFSLVELLVVLGIMAILMAFTYGAITSALISGRAGASMSNLRGLAVANLSYATDHDGFYCPAQEPTNTILWCGARSTAGDTPFDPSKGFLSPYLGDDGKVKECPLFVGMTTVDSFDACTGGYNEIYIGGTPANNFQANCMDNVPNPSKTVMFTTTAFAKNNGLQEYPFSEPYQWVDANGNLAGSLQPSVHFRDHGRALVAWCDAHVSAELPAQLGGTDYYGGNSQQSEIGFFGPTANNGYWNPAYTGP